MDWQTFWIREHNQEVIVRILPWAKSLYNSPLLLLLDIFSPFLGSSSGRAPETKALGLDKLDVQLNKETGKIIVGPDESTSVPNIYAFGDIGEVGYGEQMPGWQQKQSWHHSPGEKHSIITGFIFDYKNTTRCHARPHPSSQLEILFML